MKKESYELPLLITRGMVLFPNQLFTLMNVSQLLYRSSVTSIGEDVLTYTIMLTRYKARPLLHNK